jgi:hypothetical protein
MMFSGPASGVAGDRGDDLAGVQRTKRSAVIGRTVSSSSGASFTRSVKETTHAIPGHGNGPLSSSSPATPA